MILHIHLVGFLHNILEFRRCFLMNIDCHRAYNIILHFFWKYSWSTRVTMQNSSILICFTPSVQHLPLNTIQFRKIFCSFSPQNHFLHEPELFDHIRWFLAKIPRYFALWSYTSFFHLQKFHVLLRQNIPIRTIIGMIVY